MNASLDGGGLILESINILNLYIFDLLMQD